MRAGVDAFGVVVDPRPDAVALEIAPAAAVEQHRDLPDLGRGVVGADVQRDLAHRDGRAVRRVRHDDAAVDVELLERDREAPVLLEDDPAEADGPAVLRRPRGLGDNRQRAREDVRIDVVAVRVTGEHQLDVVLAQQLDVAVRAGDRQRIVERDVRDDDQRARLVDVLQIGLEPVELLLVAGRLRLATRAEVTRVVVVDDHDVVAAPLERVPLRALVVAEVLDVLGVVVVGAAGDVVVADAREDRVDRVLDGVLVGVELLHRAGVHQVAAEQDEVGPLAQRVELRDLRPEALAVARERAATVDVHVGEVDELAGRLLAALPLGHGQLEATRLALDELVDAREELRRAAGGVDGDLVAVGQRHEDHVGQAPAGIDRQRVLATPVGDGDVDAVGDEDAGEGLAAAAVVDEDATGNNRVLALRRRRDRGVRADGAEHDSGGARAGEPQEAAAAEIVPAHQKRPPRPWPAYGRSSRHSARASFVM